MTRRQKESLLRKVKMVLISLAFIYLVLGIVSMNVKDVEAEGIPVQREAIVVTDKPIIEEAEEVEEATPKYDLSDYEKELLTKIAMAEAENQDTEGKALVMLVVLNRAFGDNSFPDNIEDVIYAKNQFSPVGEGRFESIVPNDDCWDALGMVLEGWDESQGALYFESRSSSTWHQDNLRFLFKHQDHYFYAE